ncbi:PepSY-associated TM helix domain-containing protein [Sphingobium chlorophenolicum]|uniref:Putative iron-regulated membrane protein Iron-uptake factor PiuB n=1 Tax=Sphingobium chlorophenolicum TaxID=46429 RepID=A0A081RAG0_SPHCR|nr:PepSY-associated TM helix domain-containing protein [Sphingobium chlorophenolicum]KEQ52183.1 putative iron-regulated membrane protein Iron-uptake factor PiuB [Sphingobium chlorophenolicum]
MRSTIVLLHRWTGLATALFLAVAGLTGTALTFRDELEALINPRLFVVGWQPGAAVDPVALRDRVQRAFPQARVDYMPFPRPGRSAMFYLMPQPNRSTGKAPPLVFDQVFIDPQTGAILGGRRWGALFDGWHFQRANIVPFIWRLHEALALPHPYGKIFFGLIALLWTFDCFIGFVLTLPRGRPLLQKWKPAWQIKARAAPYRRYLDLHRAFGLWLWALLLVLAWSSVMLNLRDVIYRPIMSIALPFEDSQPDRLPTPDYNPKIDWRAALTAGRREISGLSARENFSIRYEDSLWYRPALGAYLYRTHTSLDIRETGGGTDLWIDAQTGRLIRAQFERKGAAGDVVSEWLRALHTATVFGFGYRLLIAISGLVVAMLSITGIYIWWVKRRGRTARKRFPVAVSPHRLPTELG